jgi:phosphoserine phosphatase RsbU/P
METAGQGVAAGGDAGRARVTARIVVADDDNDIRRLVAFTLRRRGYDVAEASAGDVALDLIRAQPPDLAVLDVMMPGLTGIEVARALASDPSTSHIPIIMLSAKGQTAEVQEGLASGAHGYLVKPFVPQHLADQVAAALAAPVARVEPAAARPEPTAPESPGAAGPSEVVLVVDDDPDINRLVRARLTARGYHVLSAATGEEALERIADQAPDVLFLDVSMPGISGLDVLQRLRSEERDAAVIMMTAFGSEEVAIDALRRGADDYLRKPFEPREFQAVLERTVRRLQLTRQNAALRRQLDEKREQLEAELARAAGVQARLLPGTPPTLGAHEIAGVCVPAREVGGDFFDWQIPAPGLLAVTLADVMGKGMPAALLMATVRAAMRAVVPQNGPAAAVSRAAAALGADLEGSESFVTLVHLQVEDTSGEVRYVDAGHGHAFVLRGDGSHHLLEPRGLPVGVLPGEVYEEGRVTLATGDAIVAFSDGLIDAHPDTHLTVSDIAARVAACTSAAEIVQRLVDLAGSDPLPDDLTVVAVRRTT